jgi:hypothetical protein
MSIEVISNLFEQVGISVSGYTDAELDDVLADGVTLPENK